jgi:Phage integrase, N-terminal SAM-like domain
MKLLDQVRTEIRKKHYSIRAERVYCGWIKQFILFTTRVIPKI